MRTNVLLPFKKWSLAGKRLSLLLLISMISIGLAEAQGSAFELNINCGGNAYTASNGDQFVADTYFINGTAYSNLTNPISGTTDDILYQTERYGANLSYSIPVPSSALYKVTLHFSEIFSPNFNPGARVFDMSLEDSLVLDDYDIYSDVGGYTATTHTFQIQVNDGSLDLTSATVVNNTKLCAISISLAGCLDSNYVPTVDTVTSSICTGDSVLLEGAYQTSGGHYVDTLTAVNGCDSIVWTELNVSPCAPPPFEMRINCGGGQYTSGNGDVFVADTYFNNGTTYSSTSNPISGTTDDLLFQSERYDPDLSYSIPVPSTDIYEVTLYFSEIFAPNFNVGERVFDISLEDSVVLDNYDIYADVGGYAAATKTFEIKVEDGVIDITSTSSVNYAKLCAITVVSAPIDCIMGSWGPWSACDTSCGGGQQFRKRSILVATANGGVPCGDTIEYRACNTQACPVDCQLGSWSAWSACDTTCGGGEQFRTRPILVAAANGGTPCGDTIEYRPCNTEPCASGGLCPSNIIVSSDSGSCEAVVNYSLNIDSSQNQVTTTTSYYPGGDVTLNDRPKHSFYGYTSIDLTPSSVSGSATGSDVNVEDVYLKIDHKRVGDLVIDIESPNGTVVRLIERPGKWGIWGSGGCSKDDIDAHFIPGTGNPAENDCQGNKPVLSGSYTAHYGYDLAALDDGSDPNGKWILHVYDLDKGKEGELKDWTITFKSSSNKVVRFAGLPSGSPFPVGTTTNSFVRTDSLGNKDTCSFDVTVEDQEPPVIECVKSASVVLFSEEFESGIPSNWNSSGLWHASSACAPVGAPGPSQWAYFGEDNDCDFSTGSREEGKLKSPSIEIPAGANNVNLSFDYVFDGEHSYFYDKAQLYINGNYADRYDLGPKNSWEHAVVDLSGYAGQSVILEFEFDSKDNYQNDYLGWIVDNVEISIEQSTNSNGNLEVSANDACESRVSFNWAAQDNCELDTVYQISGLSSGSIFPMGTTTNTVVAIDKAGNSNTCSFDVIVEDNSAPEFLSCPGDIFTCASVANWNAPTAMDDCGPATVTQISGPASGASIADGMYTITYEATDNSGNTSTCSFTLTKGDLSVEAGPDQSIYAGSGNGCVQLSAAVSNGLAPHSYSWSTGDNSSSIQVCPTATTTYIVTVTDANGCTGTDSVTVNVEDISCGNGKVLICYYGNTYCVSEWVAWFYTNYYGATLGPCPTSSAKKAGGRKDQMQGGSLENISLDLRLNAFPNPFTEITTIQWSSPEPGPVEVALFDVTGRLIQILHQDENTPYHEQELELNAGKLAPGIYTVRVKTITQNESLQIVLGE